MVIWFNSEQARKQLLDNGVVVTFRLKRRKRVGVHSAFYSDYDTFPASRVKFAKVRVKYLKTCEHPIEKELSNHVHLSGFKSVLEWLKEICLFMPDRREPYYGHLYRAELLERLNVG